MGRRKIKGVKQTDTGKTCEVDLMRVGPSNPRQTINIPWKNQLKEQIREAGRVIRPLECVETPEDVQDYSLDVDNGGHRLAAIKELRAENPDDQRWERVPVIITRGNSLDRTLSAGTGDGLAFDLVDEINWVRMVLNAGGSQTQIAKAKAVSTTWVADRVALITLSEATRAALRDGEITQGKAKQLAKKSDEGQAAALEAIREAKANGNSKAGSTAPKRPGVKPLRRMAELVEKSGSEQVSNLMIEGFQLGIRYATGELTAEQVAEQYGMELEG
jgi:ParB-like chromosome segregation protein Spo0J